MTSVPGDRGTIDARGGSLPDARRPDRRGLDLRGLDLRGPSPLTRLAFVLMLLLLVWLQFGPLIGLLGFRVSANAWWALSGALRDGLVLLLLGLACVARLGQARPPPLPRSLCWLLVLAVVVVVHALVSDAGLYVTALNLRRLLLVPLLFVALCLLPWTPAQVDRLLAAIVASSALVAMLGVAERLAPDTLWTELLRIEDFTAANGFDRFGTQAFHDSGRYFSGDLAAWTGQPLRRMIGSYLEPTTLAAAMAALLAMALARRARGHRAGGLVLLALLAGTATLSKGFWLFAGALLAWRALGVPSPRQLWLVVLAGCLTAWALAATAVDGALVHVGGLGSALAHLATGHWLGEGLGEAGNYNNDGVEIGDESGLGNTIAQIGLAGFLPLAWVAALARELLATGRRRRDPGAPWLAMWLLFWVLTYLFSASSLGVGGNALGFAALALYLHPASEPWRLRRAAPAPRGPGPGAATPAGPACG